MWIFDTPKTYSEMVEKISKSAFFLTLFGLYILSCASSDFKSFLESISFGAKYECFGIELNLALLYIPLCVGICEHVFKIHDKVSSVFKIRQKYDKNIIIRTFYKYANIEFNNSKFDSKNVDKIMSNVFYKYASSTDPQIDSHSIVLALNEWCWFWIFLDTALLFIVISIPFLAIKWSWINLAFLCLALVVFAIMMFLTMIQTINYTNMEIQAIWNNKERQKEIINALQSK